MTPTLLRAVVRTADARAPDPELIARFAQDRDGAAFAELVRRHGPLVWAVCRHLLPHHADAEDAFQAVFLALVRGAAAVRAGYALPAWLHATAVRVALKARRAAARRRRREQHAAVPEADRPVPDAAWANLMAAVHEEVRDLPDPERTAFVLCDLEGVRQPDAADRLGWPLGTLSGRLCKARQKLLDRLTRRGLAPATLALGGLAGSAGTVPAALAERVLSFPAAGAAGVSSAVAGLARGLVEGVTMRTKLAVGVLMLAGAVGLGGGAVVLSNADAQTGGGTTGQPPFGGGTGRAAPAPPQPNQNTFPGGPGGLGGAAKPPAWEYKVVGKPADPLKFYGVLRDYGDQGWEYVCHHEFDPAELAKAAKAEPAHFVDVDRMYVMVFKRPKGGAGAGGVGQLVGGGSRGGNEGPEEQAARRIREQDRNQDGKVSFEEADGRLRENFKRIDANGDGYVDADEYRGYYANRGGDGAGAPAKPLAGINVFELKNASAADLAVTLKKLFPAAEFVADARTNTVIARGDADTFEAVRAVVFRLEAVEAPKKKP
jgi:RNA polymerase sigma factor (sigma-70 family)